LVFWRRYIVTRACMALIGSAHFILEQALKKERAECMWKALERIIPDVRRRTEVELVATPLTHEFFNRRFKGAVSFVSCKLV